jgi:hypothetical protein
MPQRPALPSQDEMTIFLVVLLLVAAGAAWHYFGKRKRSAPTSRQPALRLRGDGTYNSAVVGVARFRAALEDVCGSDQRDDKVVEALLVPEHDAARDRKSVRVEVEGNTVGYLPANLAEAYRKRLLESGYPEARSVCNAKISIRLHSVGGDSDFTVRLDLPQKGSTGK